MPGKSSWSGSEPKIRVEYMNEQVQHKSMNMHTTAKSFKYSFLMRVHDREQIPHGSEAETQISPHLLSTCFSQLVPLQRTILLLNQRGLGIMPIIQFVYHPFTTEIAPTCHGPPTC